MAPPGWKGSGSFYNLQQFFDANQPNAQRMADEVVGYGDGYANAARDVAGSSTTRDELGAEGQQRLDGLTGQAKSLGGLTQSFPGRQTLAQSVFSKGGNYTPGMGRLDAFLMGSDPGARQTLNQAGERWGGLKKTLENEMGGRHFYANYEPPNFAPYRDSPTAPAGGLTGAEVLGGAKYTPTPVNAFDASAGSILYPSKMPTPPKNKSASQKARR